MSETTTSTAVAINEDVVPGRRVKALSTIPAVSFEDRVKVLNIMGASEPIAENLNKVIHLTNVIVQPVEMANADGEFGEVPRVTIIDKDGKSFHGTSGPLHRALMDIMFIMGHPSEWNVPLPIKVTREGQGTRMYFNVKVEPLSSK